MKIRNLILASALAVSGVSLAIAKSIDVTFSSPAIAGTAKLKPGAYRVELKGDTAVFKAEGKNEPISVPVKVQTGDKKFDVTTVEATKSAEGQRIKAINMGGSKTTLVFE